MENRRHERKLEASASAIDDAIDSVDRLDETIGQLDKIASPVPYGDYESIVRHLHEAKEKLGHARAAVENEIGGEKRDEFDEELVREAVRAIDGAAKIATTMRGAVTDLRVVVDAAADDLDALAKEMQDSIDALTR